MIGYPSDFLIDIMGICNLKCRFCPQGQNINHQPKKRLSLSGFKKLSESILPYAKKITFSNWSEPLLNRDIFGIISHIKSHSKDTIVGTSSNANYFSEDMAELLVKSKMDWLFISISGTENEVYQRYHRGGDINKVYETLTYLCEFKNRSGSRNPSIHIGYLQFPFNYTSLKDLKRTLREKLKDDDLFDQIDEIVLNYGSLTGSNLPLPKRKNHYGDIALSKNPTYLKGECTRAFSQPAIRCDGAVFPCCAIVYDSKYSFGNLNHETFEAIWNNGKYSMFRSQFQEGTNQICNNCVLYYPKYEIKFNRLILHQIKANYWWRKHLLRQYLIRHNLIPKGILKGDSI